MMLKYVKADPAGNITLLVTTRVPADQRAEISSRLLSAVEGAEQVGFVENPALGGKGRLEMMGGEFCGNGARAFALWLARSRSLALPADIDIEISGHDGVLAARVGTDSVSVPMPAHLSVREEDGILTVELPGITHHIISGAPEMDEAQRLLNRYKDDRSDAVGILFLQNGQMTPVVWVRATDSTVWESSCGSGTAACAIARCWLERRTVRLTLRQPGGVLGAEAEWPGHGIRSRIFGRVTLGEEVVVDI